MLTFLGFSILCKIIGCPIFPFSAFLRHLSTQPRPTVGSRQYPTSNAAQNTVSWLQQWAVMTSPLSQGIAAGTAG